MKLATEDSGRSTPVPAAPTKPAAGGLLRPGLISDLATKAIQTAPTTSPTAAPSAPKIMTQAEFAAKYPVRDTFSPQAQAAMYNAYVKSGGKVEPKNIAVTGVNPMATETAARDAEQKAYEKQQAQATGNTKVLADIAQTEAKAAERKVITDQINKEKDAAEGEKLKFEAGYQAFRSGRGTNDTAAERAAYLASLEQPAPETEPVATGGAATPAAPAKPKIYTTADKLAELEKVRPTMKVDGVSKEKPGIMDKLGSVGVGIGEALQGIIAARTAALQGNALDYEKDTMAGRREAKEAEAKRVAAEENQAALARQHDMDLTVANQQFEADMANAKNEMERQMAKDEYQRNVGLINAQASANIREEQASKTSGSAGWRGY